MPDFNQNLGGANPQSSGDQGSANVPSSPGVEVGVRTMESDLNSFNASGGVESSPDVMKVGGGNSGAPRTNSGLPGGATSNANGTEFTFPTNGGGGDSLTPTIDLSTPPVIEGGSPKKKLAIILAVILGVMALAVLGYFVVYPLLFPPKPAPAAIVQTNPTPPPAQEVTPVPPAEPEAQTSSSTPTIKHQSLLIIKANETQEINLPVIDLVNIKAAYLQAASLKLPSGSIKELVLLGPGATNLTLSKLFSNLLPDLSNETLLNLKDDFSLGLYFDASGTWPIYIGKLKEGSVLANAQTALAKLEESTKLANLFIENTGPAVGTFKNGQLSSKVVRYITFTNKNASIDYGWLGDYFFISTNYGGAKELARRLGF